MSDHQYSTYGYSKHYLRKSSHLSHLSTVSTPFVDPHWESLGDLPLKGSLFFRLWTYIIYIKVSLLPLSSCLGLHPHGLFKGCITPPTNSTQGRDFTKRGTTTPNLQVKVLKYVLICRFCAYNRTGFHTAILLSKLQWKKVWSLT